MNIQKLLIATVVSFVVMFGLGGFVHMKLIPQWMADHGSGIDYHRDEPILLYIGLGVLLLALVMAYLYPKGVESDNHIMEGLKFGVIMGILWTIPYSLVLFGSTNIFSLANVGMGGLVSVVIQGLGGLCIAMVYGKRKA